jgi:hypothetical protein
MSTLEQQAPYIKVEEDTANQMEPSAIEVYASMTTTNFIRTGVSIIGAAAEVDEGSHADVVARQGIEAFLKTILDMDNGTTPKNVSHSPYLVSEWQSYGAALKQRLRIDQT